MLTYLTVDQGNTDPIVISNCPSDIEVVIEQGSNYKLATWTEPTARTASREPVAILHRSHQRPQQFIAVDDSINVRYEFRDKAGNVAECAFSVTGVSSKDTFSIVEKQTLKVNLNNERNSQLNSTNKH